MHLLRLPWQILRRGFSPLWSAPAFHQKQTKGGEIRKNRRALIKSADPLTGNSLYLKNKTWIVPGMDPGTTLQWGNNSSWFQKPVDFFFPPFVLFQPISHDKNQASVQHLGLSHSQPLVLVFRRQCWLCGGLFQNPRLCKLCKVTATGSL